jgi:hypothetical protein
MTPEKTLKPYADCLTVRQITNVVHTLTVSTVLLRAIGMGMLQHRHLVVRHEAVLLLLAMLRQFSKFVTSIEHWNLIDQAAENSFKQSIMKVRNTITYDL